MKKLKTIQNFEKKLPLQEIKDMTNASSLNGGNGGYGTTYTVGHNTHGGSDCVDVHYYDNGIHRYSVPAW